MRMIDWGVLERVGLANKVYEILDVQDWRHIFNNGEMLCREISLI